MPFVARKGLPKRIGTQRFGAKIAPQAQEVHAWSEETTVTGTHSSNEKTSLPPFPTAIITSFGCGSFRRARPRWSAYAGSIRTASEPLSISARTLNSVVAEGPPMEQSRKKWGTKKGASTYSESVPLPRTADGITTATGTTGSAGRRAAAGAEHSFLMELRFLAVKASASV